MYSFPNKKTNCHKKSKNTLFYRHIVILLWSASILNTKIENKLKQKNIMFGNQKNFNDMWKVFEDMFSQTDPINKGWKTQTRESEDGTFKVTTYFYDNIDTPKTKGHSLKSQLDAAIENENFELAVKLRDQIKNLEVNQKEIHKLEMELKKSIGEQNFEKSIEIRDQLKKLK